MASYVDEDTRFEQSVNNIIDSLTSPQTWGEAVSFGAVARMGAIGLGLSSPVGWGIALGTTAIGVVVNTIGKEAVRVYKEGNVVRSDRDFTGPSVNFLGKTSFGDSYLVDDVTVGYNSSTRRFSIDGSNKSDKIFGTTAADLGLFEWRERRTDWG